MDNQLRNNEIVEYVNKLINELSSEYPNMNFNNVRDNAIITYTRMDGTFETIKSHIDADFTKAIQNMKGKETSDDIFEMTSDELQIYQQLKQENLVKKNSMGLNNAKKLVLDKPTRPSNGGYISFLIIMGIVLTVIVALVILVCNFIV